jgi:hypothetical protein
LLSEGDEGGEFEIEARIGVQYKENVNTVISIAITGVIFGFRY